MYVPEGNQVDRFAVLREGDLEVLREELSIGSQVNTLIMLAIIMIRTGIRKPSTTLREGCLRNIVAPGLHL